MVNQALRPLTQASSQFTQSASQTLNQLNTTLAQNVQQGLAAITAGRLPPLPGISSNGAAPGLPSLVPQGAAQAIKSIEDVTLPRGVPRISTVISGLANGRGVNGAMEAAAAETPPPPPLVQTGPGRVSDQLRIEGRNGSPPSAGARRLRLQTV